jgi:hypothetical protein
MPVLVGHRWERRRVDRCRVIAQRVPTEKLLLRSVLVVHYGVEQLQLLHNQSNTVAG